MRWDIATIVGRYDTYNVVHGLGAAHLKFLSVEMFLCIDSCSCTSSGHVPTPTKLLLLGGRHALAKILDFWPTLNQHTHVGKLSVHTYIPRRWVPGEPERTQNIGTRRNFSLGFILIKQS